MVNQFLTMTCEIPENLIPIGTKVYIPRPVIKDVLEDVVIGYYCMLVQIDGKFVLTPTDYKLNTINLNRDSYSDAWKKNELFLSYEEAKALAVTYPVIATDEEWLQAIGLTKDDSRPDYDEECELSSCCTVISEIRTLLHEVCQRSAITGVERQELVGLIEAHDVPGHKPVLDKILAQFDILWEDPYLT